MALSKEQIKQLENTPGIDQTLVGTYKKNNPGTTPKEAATVPSGEPVDAAARVTGFSAALNKALSAARSQRKDSTLDYLGGIVPSGALPATSFAGVLSAFDADSAPLESTIVGGALDYVKEQENRAVETKNQIRDLALAVAEAGGKQDVIASVLSFTEAGDVDGALKAAGAALSAASGDIRTIGGNLVKVEKDGSYKVLYSAPKSDDSDTTKTTPTGGTVYNDTTDMSATKAKEYIKGHTDPMFYTTLDSNHTDPEIRSFYEYWMTKNAVESMTIRADLAYSEWLADLQMAGEGVGIETTKKSDTKKTDDTTKEPWELDYGD